MRAKLKGLRSPDVDLDTFVPTNAQFGFLLEAYIGPEGSDGGEQFQFIAGTAEWLSRHGDQAPFFGRDMIVLVEFDRPKLRELLERLCDRISGESWADVARQLDRYGAWEFRDYQPFESRQ